MRYKLAISPINWRNDDLPELGKENTLEMFLTEAAQTGYNGVEMGAQFPKDSGVLKSILEPHGLSLATGWYDMGLLTRSASEEYEAMTIHRKLLLESGCKQINVCETIGTTIHSNRAAPLSRRLRLDKDDWQRFLERLDQLAMRLADDGLPMSYHAHVGTVVEDADEIDRLMNETVHTNLLFDTGHLHYAGSDPLDVLRQYSERINHIHLKDVRQEEIDRVRSENLSFLDGVFNGTFTVPNDGDLPFDSILQAIHDSSYKGWLVVEAEQNPAKAPPAPLAKAAHEYISRELNIQ